MPLQRDFAAPVQPAVMVAFPGLAEHFVALADVALQVAVAALQERWELALRCCGPGKALSMTRPLEKYCRHTPGAMISCTHT